MKIEKIKARAPLYTRTCRPGKNSSGVEGMNMPKLFMDMSKPATWLFWTLAQIRNDRTNIAEFKSSELTPVERKKTSKAYKELHGLGIIKRTKQNHYLFNPSAIHPRNKDFDTVQLIWEQTK